MDNAQKTVEFLHEYEQDETAATKFLDALRKLSSQEKDDFIGLLESYEKQILELFCAAIESQNSPNESLQIYRKFMTKPLAITMLKGQLSSFFMAHFRSGERERVRVDNLNDKIHTNIKTALQALDENILQPAIVPLLHRYIVYGAYAKPIADEFARLLKSETDTEQVENMAVLWVELLPEITRRKLRQIYLDADNGSLAKENAKRALILLGESHLLAVVENVEGDYIMDGDKIEISRSSVGMFSNRSKIKGIESISININTLDDTENNEVARAIENITTAIVESDDLSEEQQSDMLELIEEISQQATRPDDQRSPRGVIKGLLAGLATGISAAGGLAEVWSTWGPALASFFN